MVEDRRQSLWRPYPVARLPQLTAHIVEDHPTPGCATVTLTSSDEAAVPSSSFVADFATLRKCLASIQTMLLENQPAHLQLLFRVMADSPHKTSYAAWVATGEAILADMDAASAASASSSTTTTAQETQAKGRRLKGLSRSLNSTPHRQQLWPRASPLRRPSCSQHRPHRGIHTAARSFVSRDPESFS